MEIKPKIKTTFCKQSIVILFGEMGKYYGISFTFLWSRIKISD